jgi:molybdate transport system substrate-binding protein
MAAATLALVFAGALRAAGATGRVSVAAASNLIFALDALNAAFRHTHPEIALTVSTGASGSLFAQIKNGAPFDVFLSADTDYPQRLVAEKLGEAGTLRTFATGRLVLWTTRPDLDVTNIAAAVRSPTLKKLALAQPKSAPYGRAAQAALEHLGVWGAVEPRIVYGENISQTAQFVETGNADAGFVAMSLIASGTLAGKGSWSEVSPRFYSGVSLDHALVITRRGASSPAAKRYVEFLATEPAREILRRFGYHVP